MTEQEINIKIAEACGWSRKMTVRDGLYERIVAWDGSSKPFFWNGPPDSAAYKAWRADRPSLKGGMLCPPSYTTDLNAMYEAEETLDHPTFERYVRHLQTVTCADCYHYGSSNRQTIHAEAKHRAQAFVNLLKENDNRTRQKGI